jgi:hypothetical protein
MLSHILISTLVLSIAAAAPSLGDAKEVHGRSMTFGTDYFCSYCGCHRFFCETLCDKCTATSGECSKLSNFNDEDSTSDEHSNVATDFGFPIGSGLSTQTNWEITPDIAVSYPCSGGYAKNFAANANLLPDIRKKVEEVAEALGLPKKCANFCDFDNGAYETDTVSGHTDFDDEQICESDAAGGELGGCVCGSDIDPVAGCKHCSAVVKFKLNTCYDFGQI